MALPLVILGSARVDGETRKAIDIAFTPGTVDLLVLAQHHVGGYDYAHGNAEDGFGAVADAMHAADKIIFATPVYWYAMSAPLKVFFDRLTDLTETRKTQGKALAGKKIWVIASGTEEELPEGFEIPFARTAAYFGMSYCGIAYLQTGADAPRRIDGEASLKRLAAAVVAD